MNITENCCDGKHEPIITKKLFDSVQEVMANKSKPKSPKLKPYIFRGFFRCGECGCFITTETQKGHNYLRCTKRKNPCSQRYAREDAITSQIKEEIKKVSLSSVRTSHCLSKRRQPSRKIRSTRKSRKDSGFSQKDWFELPHCRPHFGFGFQKCLQNCGKIPCRGALRRGNIFQFR